MVSKQTFAEERQSLCESLHQLSRSGLSPGSTGNASQRVQGGMLISPTGLACAEIKETELVFVADDGRVAEGQLRPSSEWHMHLAIYNSFAKAGGIVHCHSRYATTLASLRKEIPAYHYMIAVAGGDSIPCADYAAFGTQALATTIVSALANRSACLMANHGQIAFGNNVKKALDLALQVEDLAAGYYQCLSIEEPYILSPEEMTVVLEQFKTYGQQAKH